MDIYSPVSGDYHLRAVSLGDYEKNEWLALDESLYDGIDVPQDAFCSFRILRTPSAPSRYGRT